MTDPPHLEHVRRSALARVEELLHQQTPPLWCEYGPVEKYISFHGGPRSPVNGLLVRAPRIEGLAQVVVVATQRTLPEGKGGFSADRRVWVRDTDVDYSLGKGLDSLAYELTIMEDLWEGRGHGRNWPAGMYRDEDLARIAVLIAWWSSYRQEFAAAPLGPASQDGLDTLRATAQAKLACLHEASLVLEMSQLVAADLTPGSQDELESQTR